jgi:HK97 family phage major capsid protein
VSPRVQPRKRPTATPAGSSLDEFRANRGERLDRVSARQAVEMLDDGVADHVEHRAFWRYIVSPRPATGSALDLLDKVERRVLSKATFAAGGYLVPQDFDEQVTTLRRSGSVIGQLAREVVTLDGRPLPLPTATTHGTSAWTAENAPTTASDETFGQVTLNAYKAITATIVSEELLDDALPAFDEFLAAELAGRQRALEETAFAVGDGTGKPLGLVHSSSGFPVVTAATGSATGFKLADAVSAYAALDNAYLPSASWLMSTSAFRSLAGLTDTGGVVLASMHAATPTLLGRPVAVSPDMPATAANARSVVFGDLAAAYTVRRVSGLGVQRQDEVYSANGQVGFRLAWRVDGRPVDTAAAVVLRNSAT